MLHRGHGPVPALVVLLSAGVALAEKPKVVVLPLEATTERLKRVAVSVAEQILTELGRTEQLETIGGSDVQVLLGIERQKQLLGCPEDSKSCLAEISAALGAPWIITGSLAQFGKATRLDIKLIRAADGKAVFRDGSSFKNESDLFELVGSIVKRLIKKIDLTATPASPAVSTAAPGASAPAPVDSAAAAPPAVSSPSPAPVPVASPVAEAVARPERRAPTRAAPLVTIAAGAAAALAGGAVVLVGMGQRSGTLAKLQDQTTPPPSYTEARGQLGSASSTMLAGALVAGVGVAALLAGLGWWLLGSSEPRSAMLSIGPAGVLVQGRFW